IYNPWTGKYYSYDNLEPISSIVGTMADATQMMSELPDHDWQSFVMASVMAMGKNAVAKQYLQGVSDFLDVVQHVSQGTERGVDASMTWLGKRLQAFVPGAGILRTITHQTDDLRRESKSVPDGPDPEHREVSYLLSALKAEI